MKDKAIRAAKISLQFSVIIALLITFSLVVSDFNTFIKEGIFAAVFSFTVVLLASLLLFFFTLFFIVFAFSLAVDFRSKQLNVLPPYNNELQDEIDKFKDKIKATERGVINIETGSFSSKLGLRESKFGGDPFMPKGFSYPKSTNGGYLYLIAQINFSEITGKLADYPEKGILQFYIADDFMWGVEPNVEDASENNLNYKVLYFEDEKYKDEDLITDFSFLKPEKDRSLPITGEFSLKFSTTKEAMSFHDFRFEKDFPDFPLEEINYDPNIMNTYLGFEVADSGHKIGGYPYFVQYDPRQNLKSDKKYELLFQMDSDFRTSANEIMWGDAGVANFFITEDDLKAKDFSKVLYNWDCA